MANMDHSSICSSCLGYGYCLTTGKRGTIPGSSALQANILPTGLQRQGTKDRIEGPSSQSKSQEAHRLSMAENAS